MLFTEEPADFHPRFEVAGCFVEYQGTILLLHRLPTKSEGNKWGIPAGKIEAGEEPSQAMKRELREETGLDIPEKDISFLVKTYVKYPEYDLIWNVFQVQLRSAPEIRIDPQEHQAYRWIVPKEVYSLDAMPDLDATIEMIYKI